MHTQNRDAATPPLSFILAVGGVGKSTLEPQVANIARVYIPYYFLMQDTLGCIFLSTTVIESISQMVSYSIILRVHSRKELQSRIKSVKMAYPLDLVSLWPLPSPHPSQYCLVEVRNEPAKLQHCLFGGTGRVFCSSQWFQGLYLDVEASIFLNSFVQDCRQYEAIAKFLTRLGPDLHSTD